MIDLSRYVKSCVSARKELHNIPEESLKEYKTKEYLINYLKENTKLEIVDNGSWFYAKYVVDSKKEFIAFRADYDAVCSNNCYKHLCGHDGHSAILLALGKIIDDVKPNKNIILIFQPAEEIGAGANLCSKIFEKERINEIYGFHNIPGFPLNKVLVKEGTMCLASVGLKIDLIGKASHAAYPESGINPSKALVQVIDFINFYTLGKKDILATIIGINGGSNNYGVSMGDVSINLTIRASDNDSFDKFISTINNEVEIIANNRNLGFKISKFDPFIATINSSDSYNEFVSVLAKNKIDYEILKDPFRWSEDFGVYLKKAKGIFFGVGDGIDYPDLHTVNFEFNDNIIETVLKVYISLIEK